MSSAEKNTDGDPRPTFLGGLIAVFLGFVLLVVGAEAVLRVTTPEWSEFYAGRFMKHEGIPGYGTLVVGIPGFDGWFSQNNGDFRSHLKFNDIGLRNDEPGATADGRVWIVGDSMAFGWGVDGAQNYTSVLAQISGQKTYNVASPGTDVCGYEALLARMPINVKPRAVILGLIIENDLSVYHCLRGTGPKDIEAHLPDDDVSLLGIKLFLTEHSALYNVLAVTFKRIPAIVTVLERLKLLEEPQHYRRNRTPEELNAVIQSTADEVAYVRTLLPANVPFAVLIAPARFDIRDGDPFFAEARTKVAAALQSDGVEVIDPIDDFRAAGFAPTHFIHDGHWSPRGHEVAATALAKWLAGALPAAQ